MRGFMPIVVGDDIMNYSWEEQFRGKIYKNIKKQPKKRVILTFYLYFVLALYRGVCFLENNSKKYDSIFAKNPNIDYKKELCKRSLEYAYENDTLSGNDANELAEEYGISDVAPNDHEPDLDRGVNPYNDPNNY